jgi:uncharacterized Zn-finger protein
LILHLNAHDAQYVEDEGIKKTYGIEENSHAVGTDTQTAVTTKNVSSCNITEYDMSLLSECGIASGEESEVASVIDCGVTNINHYNEHHKNGIEKEIKDSIEHLQVCINNVNNLNSVGPVEIPMFEVVAGLETHYNVSEVKEDGIEMSSNEEAQYMCGMCGINFKTIEFLKEHALDIHGIKYIVIEGSKKEDLLGKRSDGDMFDSTDDQHKDPREGGPENNCVQEIRQTARLCWILPKPLIREMKGADLSTCDEGNETHRVKCNLCGKHFEHQSKYEIHKYIHMDQKHWPLECLLCQKHFISKSSYNRHLLNVHELDKASSVLENLAESVPCGVCGKRYQNTGHLKRHTLMHRKISEEAFTKAIKCEQCSKLCFSVGELQRHVERIHLKVRRCLCTVCGKKFFDGSALKAHSKIHWEVKPYACGYCDKRFADAFEVKRHERGHTGEKPHVCEICGKRFRQGYFLNVHLRSHTGEKPYGCNICEAAFTCRSTLRNHKLIHVDVKAFNCTHCDKSFRTSIQLYNHVRLHTRPFKCEVCSKGFSSRVILRKHVRTHEKNYSCQKCGAQFTALHKLNKHEKECLCFQK